MVLDRATAAAYLRTMTMRCVVWAVLLVMATAGGCDWGTPPPRKADPTSQRQLGAGEVVGTEGDYGDHVWRGIPFAAPPVGALRWRAPRAPEAWSGVREALRAGSPCAQYTSPLAGVEGEANAVVGSEDCLYLNVHAPRMEVADAAAKRLPVMVWIHGGGNSIGRADFYNGGRLAAEHELIVVTANYRLGPLGWFHHKGLRGPGSTDADASGNFGTLDLIRALEWVRDNIGAFGGDPDNVTIFGESAGGTNVYTLLLSPMARGLFHRAIAQSGGLRSASPVVAENLYDEAEPGDVNSSSEAILRMLVNDKVRKDRADAKLYLESTNQPTLENYLRRKTTKQILRAYKARESSGMIDMPKIVRDGTVVPAGPALDVLASARRHNRVPVMAGTTRDENKLFLYLEDYWVWQMLGFIPRLQHERLYNLTAEYMAKVWKANGVDGPARALTSSGNDDVFAYRFDWDEEPTVLGADLSVLLGAAHGFEIPFVFGHWDLGDAGEVLFSDENLAGREELSGRMMSYWAEFAYAGHPGKGRRGDLPEWGSWGADGGGRFVVLDTAADGGVRMAKENLRAAELIEKLRTDDRFDTFEQRCTTLRSLAQWSFGVTEEDYATTWDGECAGYPLHSFPWS